MISFLERAKGRYQLTMMKIFIIYKTTYIIYNFLFFIYFFKRNNLLIFLYFYFIFLQKNEKKKFLAFKYFNFHSFL